MPARKCRSLRINESSGVRSKLRDPTLGRQAPTCLSAPGKTLSRDVTSPRPSGITRMLAIGREAGHASIPAAPSQPSVCWPIPDPFRTPASSAQTRADENGSGLLLGCMVEMLTSSLGSRRAYRYGRTTKRLGANMPPPWETIPSMLPSWGAEYTTGTQGGQHGRLNSWSRMNKL